MSIFKKFLYLLSNSERKQVYVLIAMIIIMALLDMIGVASIMPFISVLINPEIIETNSILNRIFNASEVLGVQTKQEFLFTLGIVVFLLLVLSIIFKAFTNYSLLRFTNMREYTIGRRLVEGYLHQPYIWFLHRHSADLGKSILSEVSVIIGHGLTPLMELASKSFVALAFITLLILIDPHIALIAGFIIGLAYILIYKFTRHYIKKIGKERVDANEMRFTAVSEAFGASKEVKVGGLEDAYIKRFAKPAKTYARHVTSSAIIAQMPRFALEAIVFGGMLIVILYLMTRSGSFINALPVMALYAFAGYRLMPALQGIYVAITQLRFVSPALNILYKDLKSLNSAVITKDNERILLKNEIALKNIYFDYPNANRTALKNICFNIKAFSTVGLVGTTGSGKTTTVDIILGLLEAQKGTLEIDGIIINEENKRNWQRTIGYVPQNIYLSDDTVSANIAFGVEQKNINYDSVVNASKIANLHEFVTKELDNQYETTIGERGVRLSGGQRQRIGIARALYHNPQVLILDEATSALDNSTEKAVMDEVHNLSNRITIILIAHRLSTVEKCDKIFVLEDGEVKNEGTFKELLKLDKKFRINANNQ